MPTANKYEHPAHIDGADLWNCPCPECTRLEWNLNKDQGSTTLTLKAWRATEWPEEWAR